MDDALENLETETARLKELIEQTKEAHKAAEERLQLIEQDNVQLRKILNEVLSTNANDFSLAYSSSHCKRIDALC